jgi:beta-lactamase class A
MTSRPKPDPLAERIDAIAAEAGADRAAVSCYDYETRTAWSHRGGEWFHAASTIKVPILLGVFGAVHRRGLSVDSRVHVRNRFLSAADGEPFRVESGRDANSEVHRQLGRTMKVGELAHHMIVTSSNLATNLLVDLVGLDAIRASLRELGVRGVELRRGVEDERAWEQGINNRVTADGLVSVLRPIEQGTAFSVELSARMLEILHDQEFRSGIPAGVPDGARVANKTGEISTVAHDAAIVYLPDRNPYAVVVLTEWQVGAGTGRSDTIARISRAVYEHLMAGDAARG